MFSSWAYILIGENETGKTSFQRNIVSELCGEKYDRLPRNIVKDVIHPRAPKKLKTIFTSNRSYQEKRQEYLMVENYFEKFFKDADICILASHTSQTSLKEAEQMIYQLQRRCYNVAGVFLSNGFNDGAREISTLPWQERLWIRNPLLKSSEAINNQLSRISREFCDILIARAQNQ